MKMNQKYHSFVYSIVGHVLVLALIGIELNFSKEEIHLGDLQTVLPSYAYQENSSGRSSQEKVLDSKSMVKINQLSKDGMVITKSHQVERSQQFQRKANEQTHPQINPISAGNGKPIAVLVALLHSAIQKQQQYPASALEMEREGSTTLIFILFPNGMIKDLRIVKPSGTAVLDEAAIAAVNSAIPFKNVDKYLIHPEEYQITVGFELT